MVLEVLGIMLLKMEMMITYQELMQLKKEVITYSLMVELMILIMEIYHLVH